MCVVQRSFGEDLDIVAGQRRRGDVLLDRGIDAPRDRGHAAEDHADVPVGAPDDRERRQREVPGSPLEHLGISLAPAGRFGGKVNCGNELTSVEYGLAARVRVGQHEEVGDRHRAGTRWPGDLHECIQRSQGNSGIGRMDGVTGSTAQDRKVCVFTLESRTVVATRLETVDAGPEIPAAGPLAEVSTDGAHVPQRGAPDRLAGHGERRKPFLHPGIGGDAGDGGGRADPK